MNIDMNLLFASRAFERVLCVLIGGLAIYLGYKLFLEMPERKEDSEGRAELPGGISIYVSRVGPGVFFALFGTAILSISFFSPINSSSKNETIGTDSVKTENISFLGKGEKTHVSNESRLQVIQDIERITLFEKQLESGNLTLTNSQANGLLISFQRVKRQMLQSVWDESLWGKYQSFRDWIKHGDYNNPPPEIKDIVLLFKGAETK